MKKIKTAINSMASRLRNRAQRPEKQSGKRNEVCSRCGTQLTSSRLSLQETALAVVCGFMLLAIILPAGWMAKQWIDRQEDRIFDQMYWHEPLDFWSL